MNLLTFSFLIYRIWQLKVKAYLGNWNQDIREQLVLSSVVEVRANWIGHVWRKQSLSANRQRLSKWRAQSIKARIWLAFFYAYTLRLLATKSFISLHASYKWTVDNSLKRCACRLHIRLVAISFIQNIKCDDPLELRQQLRNWWDLILNLPRPLWGNKGLRTLWTSQFFGWRICWICSCTHRTCSLVSSPDLGPRGGSPALIKSAFNCNLFINLR